MLGRGQFPDGAGAAQCLVIRVEIQGEAGVLSKGCRALCRARLWLSWHPRVAWSLEMRFA